MLIFYFILCVFPVWVIYKFSYNYNVLIGCRYFLKYSFHVFCVVAIILSFIDNACLDISLPVEEIIVRNSYVILLCLFLPLLWNIWKSEFVPLFFPSSHIGNLDYFILYLRSFNDDNKKLRWDRKFMDCLYSLFCPFAIGKPNDIKSYCGSALRIYVGDDWKERVLEMMGKAPILLFRASNTDNFYWEFEQCVLNKYIDKTILWVPDTNSYKLLREKASAKFNLIFPLEEEITDNSVFYKDKDKFIVFKLNNNTSYDE